MVLSNRDPPSPKDFTKPRWSLARATRVMEYVFCSFGAPGWQRLPVALCSHGGGVREQVNHARILEASARSHPCCFCSHLIGQSELPVTLNFKGSREVPSHPVLRGREMEYLRPALTTSAGRKL